MSNGEKLDLITAIMYAWASFPEVQCMGDVPIRALDSIAGILQGHRIDSEMVRIHAMRLQSANAANPQTPESPEESANTK